MAGSNAAGVEGSQFCLAPFSFLWKKKGGVKISNTTSLKSYFDNSLSSRII
jgi:hypothetical protein